MKRQNLSKLKAYSAVAAALTTSVNVAMAEVQHEPDVNDVIYGPWEMYQLDLDGDAAVDFHLRATSSISGSLGTTSTSSLGVARAYMWVPSGNYVMGASFYANSLSSSSGSGISTSASWSGTSFPRLAGGDFLRLNSFSYNGPNYTGDFGNAGAKYVGLKFEMSDGTHYGWVQLNVVTEMIPMIPFTDVRVDIIDYAYEDCIDTPISAGQTSGGCIATGVEEKGDRATVYSYGRGVRIQSVGKGFAAVYNVAGQEVASSSFGKGNNNINVRGVSGLYVVKVSENGKTSNHKVHLH